MIVNMHIDEIKKIARGQIDRIVQIAKEEDFNLRLDEVPDFDFPMVYDKDPSGKAMALHKDGENVISIQGGREVMCETGSLGIALSPRVAVPDIEMDNFSEEYVRRFMVISKGYEIDSGILVSKCDGMKFRLVALGGFDA